MVPTRKLNKTIIKHQDKCSPVNTCTYICTVCRHITINPKSKSEIVCNCIKGKK